MSKFQSLITQSSPCRATTLDMVALKAMLQSGGLHRDQVLGEALEELTSMFEKEPDDRVEKKVEVCEMLIDADTTLTSVSNKLIHFSCYHGKAAVLKKLQCFHYSETVRIEEKAHGPLSWAVLKKN